MLADLLNPLANSQIEIGPHDLLNEELRRLLPSESPTGFDTLDLRRLQYWLTLNQAVSGSLQAWNAVISAILRPLPARTELRTLDDPVWPRALDIGRMLVSTGVDVSQTRRALAVADSVRNLIHRGFDLRVTEAGIEFDAGELERATGRIQRTLDWIGQVGVLSNLFHHLKSLGKYEYGIYLYRPTIGNQPRDPSFPFAFMINLAVRSPVRTARHQPTKADSRWADAVTLAQELVSAVDVERYSYFEDLDPRPKDLEEILRKFALFDHLFSLRQWPPGHTAFLLKEVFRSLPRSEMCDRFGWGPEDVISLAECTYKLADKDPSLIRPADLIEMGMSSERLPKMLPFFAHRWQEVNSGYNSPIAANSDRPNLMFKPFIQTEREELLLVAQGLAGPAFYEATIASLRGMAGINVSALTDAGTVAVIKALFTRAGIEPSLIEKKYRMAGAEGECDLIIESQSEILFVECKAKALTRAAMSGEPYSALYDFVVGVFAGQIQALGHERLLRKHGHIRFTDDSILEWRNRDIKRLSSTLLDLGSLQDRMLLWRLYPALCRTELQCDPEYPRAEMVLQVNKWLKRFRKEVELLQGEGVKFDDHALSVSLGAGQLAVLLDGVADLHHFLDRVGQRADTGSFNAILEYTYLKRSGLAN